MDSVLNNKRAFTMIFFTALIFCFFIFSGYAYAENMLEVTATKVNIRSGPSTAYDKIESALKGETYRVVQEKDGWYQIILDDGEKGWIISTYVKIVTNSQLPEYIRIIAGIVNIRSGPDITYDKIGEMTPGTNFPVVGEDGDWYQIRFNDDSTGYVAKWLVEVTYANDTGDGGADTPSITLPTGLKQGLVNTDSLNLRDGPSLDDEKVSILSRNTRVAIYGREGDWYRIITETDLSGWVYCQYITLDNIFTTVVSAPETELPVWNEEGDIYGEIEMDWDEDDDGISLTLTSDDVIACKIQDGDGRVTIYTDMAIDGEILQDGDVTGKLSGDSDNILKIVYNSGIYYDKEVSEDGKELTLRFTYSPLLGKIIYIDPGHGCYGSSGYLDCGATGPTGTRESDVVYEIAKKTRDILESWGADIRLTRGETSYLSLEERAWMANAAHADIFISIHANAITNSSVNGTSTWFYAPKDDCNYDRDKRSLLAECVQEALLEWAGRADYGVREERFVVLRETDMPSILVETAFISNPTEESLLNSNRFQEDLAQGIAEGVKDYFETINTGE